MSIERRPDHGKAKITEIRQRASGEHIGGELPQVDAYAFTFPQRVNMFNLAREAWDSVFDPEVMLHDLSPSQTGEEKVKKRASLKEIRKYGLILKTGYLLFDDRHLAPPNHHKLMKDIGTLNDTFSMPGAEERGREIARYVQEEYPARGAYLDFKPASDASFRENVEEYMDHLRGGVRESIVPISSFHTMRKSVRHFMNLFQLAGALEPTEENVKMFRHLADLSKTMGDQHDLFVQQDYRGIIDYGSAYTRIRPGLQEDLIRTLGALNA